MSGPPLPRTGEGLGVGDLCPAIAHPGAGWLQSGAGAALRDTHSDNNGAAERLGTPPELAVGWIAKRRFGAPQWRAGAAIHCCAGYRLDAAVRRAGAGNTPLVAAALRALRLRNGGAGSPDTNAQAGTTLGGAGLEWSLPAGGVPHLHAAGALERRAALLHLLIVALSLLLSVLLALAFILGAFVA